VTRAIFTFGFLFACGGSVATPSPDGGSADSAPEPTCSSIGIAANVVANDELGYPTYAMHGCRLAYVDATSHDLVLRDLTNGSETVLEKSVNAPKRPVMAADVVAWEVTIKNPDYSSQLIRVLYNGSVAFVDGPASYANFGEPAAANGTVVFTAFKTSTFDTDTDVFAFDLATKKLTPVVVGPAQQRFAAVSDGIVAVTDFGEDPKGYFSGNGDLADIGVYDRSSAKYAVRKHPGKDAFPAIVSGDVLAYLHWGDVHPEPKLEAYSVYSAHVGADPATDVDVADVANAIRYLRPSASAGRLEWVTTDVNTESILWRSDLVGAPTIALDVKNQTMLASVSFSTGTLVAQNGALVFVAR
jgi:hypothetical protein